MKRLFFLTLAVFCILSSFGQDVIIKQDGTELNTKVVEIGLNEIRYKKFENLDGPTYVVSKADVFMIRYQNGERELIKVTEAPARPADITPPAAAQTAEISISPNLVRKTRTAGIVGYAMAAPIIGLAAGAAFADDFETGGILGGVATLGLGISYPLIASRARKTRDITKVDGNYPARLTGWILYGISMADAVLALALTAAEVEVPNATVIALGALGAASSILIGVDATTTASQSESYQRSVYIEPAISISRDHFGNQFTSVGVQFTF